MVKNKLLDLMVPPALTLAAEQPWADVSLADICAASGTTLADCAAQRVTKSILEARLDADVRQAMLAAIPQVDAGQGVRDRLFDTIMARFDAMEDARAAWLSILQAYETDSLAQLAHRARRLNCAAWALEACGVSASGAKGGARAFGLARILATAQKVWRQDGPDLAKTMARVDQDLRRAETWALRAQSFERFVRPGR